MRAFTHSCVAAATKTCAVLSALALLLASVPAAAYASVAQSVGEDEVCVSDLVLEDDPLAELPDADELAEGYIESVFYADDEDALKTQANYGLIYLEDETQLAVYAALKSFVADVAANGGSTQFTYTFDTPYNAGYSTYSENLSALDISSIIACLRDDCPYEMYWFDKSIGLVYTFSYKLVSGSITYITFKFSPGTDYVGDEDYTVDESKAQATATAAANAKAIVEEHADEATVLDTLLAYRDEICDLTSYNSEAAASDSSTVGINPWQLVWVFDGDEDTTVVCEGYSKAFQYLCDLTWPDNDPVTCYTVTGYLEDGGHMFNIVRVDDLSYLVDVTNSDSGTVGYSGGLFLAHDSLGTGSVSSGYTMVTSSKNVEYTYKEATISLYGETILTLATTAFPGLSSSSTDDGEGDWNVVRSSSNSYRWRITSTGSVLQIAPREGNSTGTISGISAMKFTVTVTTTSMYTSYSLSSTYSGMMPWSSSASSITAVEVADGMSVAGAARGLFCNLSAATSISLPEGFVTSDVTALSGMFAYCESLTSLAMSGWDTSSVTDSAGMFACCESLTALDLSGWDTSAVTDFTGMFYKCSTLATISVCNCWSTQNAESSTGMFMACSALEGGNGTSYNAWSTSYVDATRACLDTDDATGYLTLGTLVTATVASEDGEEVTTGYSSLQDALDAADTSEATLTLACDVTEGATIASGSTVTLDLAGRSLTAATPALACAGTLSILDSDGDGVVTATADDDDAAAYAVSATGEGSVTIASGRFAGELATSDDATIAVSGGLFSEELASEHVAAGLARAHMSGGVADESYPYTVVEQCYTFLGGSLRMDYTTTDDDGNTVADYTQTSLRFGYTITSPDDADADSVSWSWTYGRADSDTWMGTVNGTYKTDLGDNSWRSNIVITGVPSTSYSETLRTRLTVVYTCSDGTTYTVTDADQTRSVSGVAAAILDSEDDGNDATKASESEVTYATGIAAVAGASS